MLVLLVVIPFLSVLLAAQDRLATIIAPLLIRPLLGVLLAQHGLAASPVILVQHMLAATILPEVFRFLLGTLQTADHGLAATSIPLVRRILVGTLPTAHHGLAATSTPLVLRPLGVILAKHGLAASITPLVLHPLLERLLVEHGLVAGTMILVQHMLAATIVSRPALGVTRTTVTIGVRLMKVPQPERTKRDRQTTMRGSASRTTPTTRHMVMVMVHSMTSLV